MHDEAEEGGTMEVIFVRFLLSKYISTLKP